MAVDYASRVTLLSDWFSLRSGLYDHEQLCRKWAALLCLDKQTSSPRSNFHKAKKDREARAVASHARISGEARRTSENVQCSACCDVSLSARRADATSTSNKDPLERQRASKTSPRRVRGFEDDYSPSRVARGATRAIYVLFLSAAAHSAAHPYARDQFFSPSSVQIFENGSPHALDESTFYKSLGFLTGEFWHVVERS